MSGPRNEEERYWNPNIGRLISAAGAVWDRRDAREVADIYGELQELYNAMRAVTGEACEHDWIPKIPGTPRPLYSYCGKCGADNPEATEAAT